LILTLVRHGDAVAAPPGESDASRPLTDRGHAQARAVARYLLSREAALERIFTSPLRRAVETAAPIAAAFGRPAEPAAWLAAGARPEDLANELHSIEVLRVALVGHAPDLGLLAAFLTGGDPEISLGKGGLARVEIHPPYARGLGALREILDADEIERRAPPED